MNQNGMSILSVLISSSIGIGIITAMTQSLITIRRTASSVRAGLDFNNFTDTIQSILNNSITCQLMFSATPFNLPAGTLPNNFPNPLPNNTYPINPPIAISELTLNGRAIATVNATIENHLKIIKIQFDQITPIKPIIFQYTVNLNIQAQKVVGGGGAVGSPIESKNFSLSLTLDPTLTRILKCSTPVSDSYWQTSPTSSNDIENTNSGALLVNGDLTAVNQITADSFSGKIDAANIQNILTQATIPAANITGFTISASSLTGSATSTLPDPLHLKSLTVTGTLTNNAPEIQSNTSTCPNGSMASGIHFDLVSPYNLQLRLKCK